MRFLSCLFFSFIFLTIQAKAQHSYYVYIQTENKQAFYVRLNGNVLSSTGSGYLVIPKLTNNTYKLNIGFPKKEWPEQAVDITINEKDEGFLLKNFGPSSWGLFNMQSMAIIMGSVADTNTVAAPKNRTDNFSNTLAEVTNTPSIKQEQPVAQTAAIQKTDTSTATTAQEKPVVTDTPSIPKEKVKQVFSLIDNSGRSLLYTISNEAGMDTVRIFIPYDNKAAEPLSPVADTAAKAIEKELSAAPVVDTTVRERKVDSVVSVVSSQNEVVKQDIKPVITDVKVSDAKAPDNKEYTVTVINPACKASATDDDFLRLRKKMAAAENDEDMIAAAKKGFKSKCFTTDQVKNLSLLFLKDEGRYNFYDASYGHVSDIGNFKSLQSQLSDEYYINRFKAMLR